MKKTSSSRRLLGVALASIPFCILSLPPASATAPGHDGRLLFQADTGSGNQLYVMNVNANKPVQITHVLGEAVRGDWSPTGRRIAFELDSPESVNIALVDPDGDHLQVLPTVGGGLDSDPSFTPDGKRLVFERFDPASGDDAVWSMALDGTDRHRIATGPNGAQDPNVSPDGTTLTFVGAAASEQEQALFAVSMGGGQRRQLTPFSLDVAIKHDWAPDGRHLVLSDNANVDAPANVATMTPDGADLTYLTHYSARPGSAYVGSYSPNGRWIVYRFEEGGQYGLRRMHPDGSDVRTILPASDFRPRFIDWGPVR